MTVFTTGGYLAGKHVFPVNYSRETVSQRLINAAHVNDLDLAMELLGDPLIDVNFVGTVCLKSRRTELVLRDEGATEVRVEFEEFNTEVTPLFLAAHNGNVTLLRKLLRDGGTVNYKLFRGYATTAAVREGHVEILDILIKAGGASQPACEGALLEASQLGRATAATYANILMASEMIRPHVALHALVTASSRGFIEFVDSLLKFGVDVNATARVLLQSSNPPLYANVNCNALVAAIVNRQESVVLLLLQGGARTDTNVRLGAWFWEVATGEEFRVGAGLADPYPIIWCAVEYFEATGAILKAILQHITSPNIPHFGRTILHHAVLCGNSRAVQLLLSSGANAELPVDTTRKLEYRPIHMAARYGFVKVLYHLINAGCDLNARMGSGETALMISARYKHEECLKALACVGADFGLTSCTGECGRSIAESVEWTIGFREVVIDVIRAGKVPQSTNPAIFSPLLFIVIANDIGALKELMEHLNINLDEKDGDGFTALMLAAKRGYVEAFELLLHAGADITLSNKYGETAISLLEANVQRITFENLMVECIFAKGNHGGFSALHFAVQRGDLDLVRTLITKGYDVNELNSQGYTPLMLAAKAGNITMCRLLISCSARCNIENTRSETALSLARNNGVVEEMIVDELARELVLEGEFVKKHTKGGKGVPHRKMLKMLGNFGVLRWGKSRKRNVICQGAEVGASSKFRWNRRKKLDADAPGVFRVVTTKKKEIHFECEGGIEMAELWVRGIKLLTREAINIGRSGKQETRK